MLLKKNKVTIIAEAGVNHNGSIRIAKKLIDIASDAGSDIIKFQTYKTENLITKNAPKAKYQKKTTNIKETQFEMLKKLELNERQHEVLIEYCSKKKIEFLSSPFDLPSIDLLKKLNLKRLKIPSSELTNHIYLKKISSFKGEIIFSTGMSTLNEIKSVYDFLIKNGVNKKKISILHCNSDYPTDFNDVNLRSMLLIKKRLNVNIGYSDHSVGSEVPIAAAALGAKIIEKHFTLDKKMEGPDHKVSLDPIELKYMIKCIRNVERSLGKSNRILSRNVLNNIKTHTKSIVASKSIKKGDKFTLNNLTAKRPGTGLHTKFYKRLLNKNSKKNYKVDDLISKKEL